MAEAAAAAPAAAPAAPETNAAPETAKAEVATAATSSTEAKPSETQPPAQKPNEDERRAQRIAAARRESARVAAEREAVARDRAAHAEDIKLAAEFRRLQALRDKEGDWAFSREVKLKVADVSKGYLQEGQGKTPEQIAEEVYAKREAERQKREQETSTKAAEEQAIRAREAAYAGAKTTLGKMIADGGQRFEMCGKLVKNGLGDVAVDKAFKLIEDFHAQTKQILDFGKALDAVEAKFKGLAKADEVVQPADKAAARPAAGSKSAPVKVADVSEVETKPSTTQPIRRMTPRDQKRIAQEMIKAAKAAQDT